MTKIKGRRKQRNKRERQAMQFSQYAGIPYRKMDLLDGEPHYSPEEDEFGEPDGPEPRPEWDEEDEW